MSKSADHPKYARDVIIEALCEIKFAPSDTNTPSLAHLTGAAYKKLSDTFTDIEPISDPLEFFSGLPVGAVPAGVLANISGGRTRFRTAKGDRLIQLSRNSYSFHIVGAGNYTKRDDFVAEVLTYWKTLLPEISPLHVLKIGMRYVNQIPLGNDQKLNKWLKPSKYLPEVLINSESGFNSRIEIRPTPETINIVIVGEKIANDTKDIIFDIDSIDLHEYKPNEDLQDKIKLLHERIWDVFKSSQTEHLCNFMDCK